VPAAAHQHLKACSKPIATAGGRLQKKALDAWHAAGAKLPRPSELLGNRNRADSEHLNRWIKHPRVEETWDTIHTYAPDLAPEVLIKQVLNTRGDAIMAVIAMFGSSLSPSFKDAWGARVSDLRKDLREVLKGSPGPIYVFQQLERATNGVQLMLEGLYLDLGDLPFDLSRQGSNDDRARDAFQELMSGFFQEHTGRKRLKLHDGVAVLTDIAIPIRGKSADPGSAARRQSRRGQKN
jgi:hypothetical protein